MEAVFLQLMHVMLSFLHAVARENAFSLFVNLQHVELGLFSGPSKNLLEHMRNVLHVIHRVVPADDQVARLQLGLRPSFCLFNCAGLNFRGDARRHIAKLKQRRIIVEAGPGDPEVLPVVSVQAPDWGSGLAKGGHEL